jgi:beta-xylosidase
MKTHIYVQEMAPDGLRMAGEPVALIVNDQPWEGDVIEAPTMVKHGEKYYLFYSANDYGSAKYAVGYALCDTAVGPCKDAPENPILKSRTDQDNPVIGPGHQAIIAQGGQTWIFYHAWEANAQGQRTNRRLIWLDRLDWVDDKPVVLGPTSAPQPAPVMK